jgi:hypothetical protein
MEASKNMQQQIDSMKFLVAEVWLAAVLVACFEYLGAGPGGFRACAGWLLCLMVVKFALKRVSNWLQYESLKKIPPGKPCLQNLSVPAQEKVKYVNLTGAGVCSKCRWSSGCYECDGPRALLYWLKKEGFDAEAIAHLDIAAELEKMTAMEASKNMQQQIDSRQSTIVEAGRLLKSLVAEEWWAAVLVACFEYLGAGPGGFRACALWLLCLMVAKFALKRVSNWLQYAARDCQDKLHYLEKRQMQRTPTLAGIFRQVEADMMHHVMSHAAPFEVAVAVEASSTS